MQEQQEQSLTTLLLANTSWDFSLRKISAVHTVTTLSKLDIIFFMNVEDITSIEIQGEIQ